MLRMRSVPNKNTINYTLQFTFSRQHRIWSFQVPVSQRTAKKCTKDYNARAQPLVCSLNGLFGEVLVAVPVVFCMRSPLKHEEQDQWSWYELQRVHENIYLECNSLSIIPAGPNRGWEWGSNRFRETYGELTFLYLKHINVPMSFLMTISIQIPTTRGWSLDPDARINYQRTTKNYMQVKRWRERIQI